MSTPEPDGTTSNGSVGIKNPHPHDVLSGRGGASNNHIGNAVYRTIVEHNKALYKDLPRADKSELACSIVDAIYGLDPPGRFLERRAKKKKAKGEKKKRRTKSDDDDDLWYEIEEKKARDKTAQALREKVHKARTIPAEQVPVSLRHFLRDGFDGGASAAATAAGTKRRGGSRAAAASKRSGGTKRKAERSGEGDADDEGGSSDDGGGSDRSASGGGGGAPANGGSSKKLKLDPRFFFRGTSLSTSMRNLGKGVGGGGGLRSPLDWTQRFSSTSEHDKAADESDADKKDGAAAGGQRIEPLPLPHIPPKAPLHETGTRDKSFCPETALQDSPSLFDFFSNFRQSTRSLFGGLEPAPLPPATAATSSEAPRGRGLGGGDATPRAGQEPSAAAAATAATEAETENEEALALDAALPQPGGGSKRRRARTALTHSAVVANNASPSPVERTSTLTSDISSFLPSFLERGATAVLDHIGSAPSFGRAVTSMFGMGSPGTSQSSQEGSLREAGAGGAGDGGSGAGPLASPRPMALTRNDRESTLMRDDEEEETEFEKRLRVVPPSSMRASSV